MSRAQPSRMVFGLAFAGIFLPFVAGVAVTYARHPHLIERPAIASAPEDPLAHGVTYLPLPNPITTNLISLDRTLVADLTFALPKGSVNMLELGPKLLADVPVLTAALSETIRDEAEKAKSPEELRQALPAALLAVVNGRYGTEENPTPVAEVLITSYVLQ